MLCAATAGLAGCGSGAGASRTATQGAPPVLGRPAGADQAAAAASLGFPGFATRNTTRVGGADPVADAAGVAQAVYPAVSADTRPAVVVIVDAADWRSAISASQLMSAPLRAPILFSRDGKLPQASQDALDALKPTGAEKAGNAQVIRIGNAAAKPAGVRSTDVAGADFAGLAQGIDRLHAAAAGAASQPVIVAPSDRPAYAMVAAGLAARTGAPVLWSGRDALPTATRQAIAGRKEPTIYILGPEDGISKKVAADLGKLGAVRRMSGPDPVRNAIAVARFSAGRFGWNVVDPGHGLVFASSERPADAAAAAPLSASGTNGPLLLVPDAKALPAPVEAYLLDIQPGYDKDPVRGVYNHGWVIGDAEAISVAVQARIDRLLEIQPVDTPGP
jgi:hypothetical protein